MIFSRRDTGFGVMWQLRENEAASSFELKRLHPVAAVGNESMADEDGGTQPQFI
jgi:hypothetical protein